MDTMIVEGLELELPGWWKEADLLRRKTWFDGATTAFSAAEAWWSASKPPSVNRLVNVVYQRGVSSGYVDSYGTWWVLEGIALTTKDVKVTHWKHLPSRLAIEAVPSPPEPEVTP